MLDIKQKLNKYLTLKNTIWIYLTIFAVLILAFLWLFQILSLGKYYEISKTNEIKNAANIIKINYSNTDNLNEILNELKFEKNICIDIYNEVQEISYNNCISPKHINTYINALKNNNDDDIIFKNNNKFYKRNSLVYGFKINNDYILLSTVIEPIDSTVIILKNQFIIVSIVILILSFLVGLFISKKLSKPIEELDKSAKEIAKGNYNVEFKSNTNINEIKELTATLNNAKNELAKTDELRKDLLANVSHDLKTPLTMIKAYSEMVRDITYKNKIKREDNLNIIIEEVDRLNLLVNDILDLSSIQANVYKLNKEDFNIIELIKTIINRYKIFTLTEEYTFEFNYSKKECIINADKKKIEQAIYNLINNAINYTGNDKKIIINLIENNNNIRIEIKDTGKGIKKEELNLIWDKYYKNSKKHKRNMIGTGLGLSIVKNIFETHKYKYGVESILNEGSTFYFEIKKEKSL